MTLDTLIPLERVFARLPGSDKAGVLGELARRAAGLLDLPAAPLAASITAREALGSTGVGGGFAVPHARVPALGAMAGFFARLERPIDFAAIDGKPVDLVFLLLSTPEATAEHLAALAAISRRLRDKNIAEAIRRTASAQGIRDLLIGVS